MTRSARCARRSAALIVGSLITVVGPLPVRAQESTGLRFVEARPAPVVPGPAARTAPAALELAPVLTPDSTSRLRATVGGVVGGAVGFLAGGMVGVGMAEASSCFDYDCLLYPVVGAAVGQAVGIPVGVYLGSDRSSDLSRSLGTSATFAAGGILISLVSNVGVPVLFVGVPAAELFASLSTVP
jgi:hypothetical protein